MRLEVAVAELRSDLATMLANQAIMMAELHLHLNFDSSSNISPVQPAETTIPAPTVSASTQAAESNT